MTVIANGPFLIDRKSSKAGIVAGDGYGSGPYNVPDPLPTWDLYRLPQIAGDWVNDRLKEFVGEAPDEVMTPEPNPTDWSLVRIGSDWVIIAGLIAAFGIYIFLKR